MRTGMACIGLALGMKAVFKDTAYPLIAKGVAELFILIAIAIFWSAVTKSRRTLQRMDEHDIQTQSYKRMTTLACLLTFGAVTAGFTLWFL